MIKKFFTYFTSLWLQFEQNINTWGFDPYSLGFIGVGFILGVTSGAMLLLGIGATGVMLPPLGLFILGAGIVGSSILFGLKCFLDHWSKENKIPTQGKQLCPTYKLLQKHEMVGFDKINHPQLLTKKVLPEHVSSPLVLPQQPPAAKECLTPPCQFVKNVG